MIRPTKYLDTSTCVLSVSATIITELRRARVIPLKELDELVSARLSNTAHFNFIPALSFLFLLGVISYEEQLDTITLISVDVKAN